MLSLQSNGEIVDRGKESQPPSAQYLFRYSIVRPGDLVVNPMWLPGGGIGVTQRWGAVSPEYRVYKLSSFIDPRYLHYLLRSRPYLAQYQLLIRAETTFDRRVTKADFSELPVLIPPLATQEAIVNVLDVETARVDELIAKKLRMINLLLHRFASRRAQLLLPSFDPLSRGSVVPRGWEGLSLGVLIQLQRGHDLPLEARQEGSVPVVSSGGVIDSHREAIADGPGVITGRYGTVGAVFFVDEPYWPLNTTLYVADFRGNYPRWVFHLLSALPLDVDAAKSAVTGINRNVIGQLQVPRPPTTEQKRLASELDRTLDSTERLVDHLTHQVALLRERRQALITVVVTGRVEVPEVAA